MRRKLLRFQDNAERRNILQPGKEIFETIKGKWNEVYFDNSNPIAVELACGRGEYTVGLARVNAQKNYIGVDIKGNRMWVGSTQAIEENLFNVAFLRTKIQLLESFFENGEISEIWIIFPDPRPKDRDERRRLTNNRFLDIYKNLLKPGGSIHLKTDNTALFNYTLDVLKQRNDVSDLHYTYDLYNSEMNSEHYGIRTRYEAMFNEEGHAIKYLRFNIEKQLAPLIK